MFFIISSPHLNGNVRPDGIVVGADDRRMITNAAAMHSFIIGGQRGAPEPLLPAPGPLATQRLYGEHETKKIPPLVIAVNVSYCPRDNSIFPDITAD